MKVSIIGLGKLGSPMAAVYASKGFEVIGVDKNPTYVEAINAGKAPVDEPQLQEFIDANKERLTATLDTSDAVKSTDVTFVIVPTPSGPDGSDVNVVTQAIGCDSRIGHKYLKGAVAYGGPCFPRDNVAFGCLADQLKANADIAIATDSINRGQKDRVLKMIKNLDSKPKKIGVLGLSYKPGTPVIEESQGISLAVALLKAGYEVVVYDPMAMPAAKSVLNSSVDYATSAEDCIQKCDSAVLMTAWPEFSELKADAFSEKDKGFAIIDCWRVLQKSMFKNVEVVYQGAACLAAAQSDPESILLVMPSDHLIEDKQEFLKTVHDGLEDAESGHLPHAAAAESYISSKQYLWNSGIFLFKASSFLDAVAAFEPEILGIYYGIMERSKSVKVVPLSTDWNDLGSWEALWDTASKDESGRLVTVVGLDDVIVVDSQDAVLVAARSASQDVKKIVETLQSRDRPHTHSHPLTQRPWGTFQSVDKAAVYGTPEYTPIDENHPLKPINPYGHTKHITEIILQDWDKAYGLKSVSLRYFNAAGAFPEEGLGEAHEPETHLIPLMIRAAQHQKAIQIFGNDYDTADGTCVRDYIHELDMLLTAEDFYMPLLAWINSFFGAASSTVVQVLAYQPSYNLCFSKPDFGFSWMDIDINFRGVNL
eukprot:gene11333-11421_t